MTSSPQSTTPSRPARPITSDPLTRELQELALALRADAPEPDAEFRRELGRRVRERLSEAGPSLRRPLLAARAHPRLRDRARRSADRADRDPRRRVWRLRRRRRRGIERRRRAAAAAPPRRRSSLPSAPAEGARLERAADQAAAAAAAPWPFRPTAASRPASAIARSSARSGLSWRCRSTRWPAWPSR